MRFTTLRDHLPVLHAALDDLDRQYPTVESWAAQLQATFDAGGRLLVCGNGGSAAQAQHLTAELVGRFEQTSRPGLPAIALHAETSTLTAITNDFGADESFARQVEAHGRPGDVLILLSTSGSSTNLVRAAERGASRGLRVLAMTGPRPNPLAAVAEQVLAVEVAAPTAVQEAHLVAVHALCAALEQRMTVDLPAAHRRRRPAPAAAFPRYQGDRVGTRRERS